MGLSSIGQRLQRSLKPGRSPSGARVEFRRRAEHVAAAAPALEGALPVLLPQRYTATDSNSNWLSNSLAVHYSTEAPCFLSSCFRGSKAQRLRLLNLCVMLQRNSGACRPDLRTIRRLEKGMPYPRHTRKIMHTLFRGLEKGSSVPALRRTPYCVGVRSWRHSASLCVTLNCTAVRTDGSCLCT